METGSKQFMAARGSVITAVANNTSTQLQPTDQSLVQGSLVWNHHYAITKGHDIITSVLCCYRCLLIDDVNELFKIWKTDVLFLSI